MIKWKEYNSETGEDIEFCCDSMQKIYRNLVHWDQSIEKWCIEVKRKTIQHNAQTGKNVEIIEKDKLDLLPIDYCPFCGKNIYKDELRYDTTGSGWGGFKISSGSDESDTTCVKIDYF